MPSSWMISLEVVEKKKKDGDLGEVRPNSSAHPKYEAELAHSWNGKISVRFCYTMCYCLGQGKVSITTFP